MLCDCSSLSCDTQPLWWHCEASEWTSSQPSVARKVLVNLESGAGTLMGGTSSVPLMPAALGQAQGCAAIPLLHGTGFAASVPIHTSSTLVGMCLRAASSDPGGSSFHLFQSSWTAFQKHLALQVVRTQPPPTGTPLPGRSWIFSIQQGRRAFSFPSFRQRWL